MSDLAQYKLYFKLFDNILSCNCLSQCIWIEVIGIEFCHSRDLTQLWQKYIAELKWILSALLWFGEYSGRQC